MIRAKRIQSDIKELTEYKPLNIHYSVLDDDNGAVLMYGAPNSPYEFFPALFRITFPPSYPFKQPVIRFCNAGKAVVHPLLEIGKPVEIKWWSASLRLSSALMAIYGLLQNNPLKHDCAYSIVDASMNSSYNDFLTYMGGVYSRNYIESAVTPKIAAPFLDIIKTKYENWLEKYGGKWGNHVVWDNLPYNMIYERRV
jgi:ubiquitin-protein ligase